MRVTLSPAEKEQVRKLSGKLIPIYASVVLALLAVTLISNLPQSDSKVEVAGSITTVTDGIPAR
jgi:hypothetical protein